MYPLYIFTMLHAPMVARVQEVFIGKNCKECTEDFVIAFDGVSELSNPMCIHKWKQAKKDRDARVFSFIIGNNEAGGLAPISDFVYFIDTGHDPAGLMIER